MNVDREQLLKELESVTPGLSARELVEQSNCFVFMDGKVATYNDEVTCSTETCLKIRGAVQSSSFLGILRKLSDTTLDISMGKTRLNIKCKKRENAWVSIEKEISLPVESIKRPKKWISLPITFSEGLSMVGSCVGKDQTQFHLTCVHLHPEWIEACDNFRAARYGMGTGLEKSILVRKESLSHVTQLGMTEFGLTKSWIHFRNANGLTLSCRLYIEEYPDLSEILNVKGVKTTFPKGLEVAVDRASVFSKMDADEDHIVIDLQRGKVRVKSEGVTGGYSKTHKIRYKKRPMKFTIAPALMAEILKKYNEVVLGKERLKVGFGQFTYITVLGVPESAKQEETEVSQEVE